MNSHLPNLLSSSPLISLAAVHTIRGDRAPQLAGNGHPPTKSSNEAVITWSDTYNNRREVQPRVDHERSLPTFLDRLPSTHFCQTSSRFHGIGAPR